MIGKRLTMKGFIVSDWARQMPQFLSEVARSTQADKSRFERDGRGWDRPCAAGVHRLIRGGNVGKMVVKI